MLIHRSKQIKLFLAGDYEFLSKLYGLSGANGRYMYIEAITIESIMYHCLGRHFCLYCLIATQDSYLPYENQPVVQLRTLESIKRDHDRFIEAGGNLKKVKDYNNCPMEAIFDIPLDQVINIIVLLPPSTYSVGQRAKADGLTLSLLYAKWKKHVQLPYT